MFTDRLYVITSYLVATAFTVHLRTSLPISAVHGYPSFETVCLSARRDGETVTRASAVPRIFQFQSFTAAWFDSRRIACRTWYIHLHITNSRNRSWGNTNLHGKASCRWHTAWSCMWWYTSDIRPTKKNKRNNTSNALHVAKLLCTIIIFMSAFESELAMSHMTHVTHQTNPWLDHDPLLPFFCIPVQLCCTDTILNWTVVCQTFNFHRNQD